MNPGLWQSGYSFPVFRAVERHMALLEVKNLQIDFIGETGPLRIVEDVSFSVEMGQSLCLVGESGCGKTVTALALARLLPSPPASYSGEIWLDGRNVLACSNQALRALRGGIVSYVFQNPGSALNPVMRIGTQILEALRRHCPRHATSTEIVRLLSLVGIADPKRVMRQYPHQLSGGMQQRSMIAMALAPRPRLLIADEPTTALDVTIQAQIMDLLAELKRRLNMSLLLITHNLGIVSEIADTVAVMYAGQIVETAPVKSFFAAPRHPYSVALLSAVPHIGQNSARLDSIPGNVPVPTAFPSGCRFHPRCGKVQRDCAVKEPEWVETGARHWARCQHWRAPFPSVAV